MKATTELRTDDRLATGERVESVLPYVNGQSVQQDDWRLVSLSSWTATGEVVDGEQVGVLSARTVRAHVDVTWKVA